MPSHMATWQRKRKAQKFYAAAVRCASPETKISGARKKDTVARLRGKAAEILGCEDAELEHIFEAPRT